MGKYHAVHGESSLPADFEIGLTLRVSGCWIVLSFLVGFYFCFGFVAGYFLASVVVKWHFLLDTVLSILCPNY